MDATPLGVLFPSWVSHSGESRRSSPIYSVDVHPTGSKFATGGGDSFVKIWELASLKKEFQLEKGHENQLLAILQNHNGTVNCVKWSRDGKYLASGSDDRSVMIWKRDGLGSSSSFGQVFVESWACRAVLSGATTEVLGLAWDPQSRRVASCHVDNKIVIWNALEGKQTQELRGHNGWVTGVTWDPKDRFLASQALDGSVIIWNIQDGVSVKRIDKPFEAKQFGRTGGISLDLFRQVTFTRLSWSPDGKYLAACRGYYADRKAFVSPVFERGSWKAMIEYTGHNRPTTVVRYCPRMLRDLETGKPVYAVAIGGMDNKLTLWISSRSKTLLSVEGAFSETVLDLAWTPDGTGLLICSHCGKLVYIRLNLKEHLNVAYGPSLDNFEDELGPELPADGLIQCPEILELRKAVKEDGPEKMSSRTKRKRDQLNGEVQEKQPRSLAVPGSEVEKRQIEVRTSGGRRRIVPVSANSEIPSSSMAPAPGPQNLGSLSPKLPVAASAANGSPMTRLVGGRQEAHTGFSAHGPGNDANENPAQRRRRHVVKQRIHNHSGWMEPEDVPASVECSATVPRVDDEKLASELRNGRDRDEGGPPTHEVVYHARSRRIAGDGMNAMQQWVVTLTDGKNHLWSQAVSSRVVALCMSPEIVVAGCDDNLLHVFTINGRRAYLPLVLNGIIYRLSLGKENTLLVVTCDETIRLYSLPSAVGSRPRVALECSLSSLRFRHPNEGPSDVWLCKGKVPAVSFPNFSRYVFDVGTRAWVLASSHKFWASEFLSMLDVDSTMKPLPEKSRLMDTAPYTSKQHTLQHLEHKLSEATMQEDAEAFKSTLIAYAKQLALYSVPRTEVQISSESLANGPTKEEGNMEFRRLDELVKELLGPYDWSPGSEYEWNPHITLSSGYQELKDKPLSAGFEKKSSEGDKNLGLVRIGKRELLRSLLPHLSMAPRLQSYVVLLQSTLSEIE